MNLLLKNLEWEANGSTTKGDIRIQSGRIEEIGLNLASRTKEHVVDLSGHFIYPGLINSHDHLEMNLYSRLGTPPYKNYVEWASDIYKPNVSPIREIEKVKINDRLMWGGLKNLISGVTTVVHHNPWHRILREKTFPVRVLKKMTWAHSLALEKKLKPSVAADLNIPFVIHAAEGVDEMAFLELAKLKDLELMQKNLVIVHGIAIDPDRATDLIDATASVIWCPASNIYMFGETARVEKLKTQLHVALGTDSMLTGSRTLLDEMRFALKTNKVTNDEVYRMVTEIPSAIFNLPAPAIEVNRKADVFIARNLKPSYLETLFSLQPADIMMSIIDGNIQLQDEKIQGDWKSPKYHLAVTNQVKKVNIDVAGLMARIERKVGSSILKENELWNLINA